MGSDKNYVKVKLSKTVLPAFLALTALSGVGGFFYSIVWKEFKTSFAYKEFKKFGIYGTYKKHFFSFVDHIDGLKEIEIERDRLSEKLAILESKIEKEKFEQAEQDHIRFSKSTKGPVTFSEIHYDLPKHLLPHELYVLGLGYYRQGKFDRALKIFTHLHTLKEDTSYQRATHALLIASCWTKLGNAKESEKYLSIVEQSQHLNAFQKQAVLVWKALNDQILGLQSESQKKLLSLIGEYPRSHWGRLVNGGLDRAPARLENEGNLHLQSKKEKFEQADSHNVHTEADHHEVTPAEGHHD